MRLFTGPPGSGKTAVILNELRAALRAGEGSSVRLLVPTATLAQHMQNELAREGFVFPSSVVQTLKQFIADWRPNVPEVPETIFYWIVEAAARRLNRAEFAAVIDFPGFSASLAKTIAEFAAAGCDSARLGRSPSGRPPRRSVPRRLSGSGSRTGAERACDARAPPGDRRRAHRGGGCGRGENGMVGWISCASRARVTPHRRIGETRAGLHIPERFRGGWNPRKP